MDRIYAPWRLAWVKRAARDDVIPAPSGCIFCDYAPPQGPPPVTTEREPDRRAFDKRRLVITVRRHAFVILNRFPYGTAHVMVVPRAHAEHIDAVADDVFHDTQLLLRETVRALREEYRPDGVNIGMNVGAAAGAGIAAHCHWHVLPRWTGDVNFLPVFADVKVLSEMLEDTWERLARRLRLPEEDAHG